MSSHYHITSPIRQLCWYLLIITLFSGNTSLADHPVSTEKLTILVVSSWHKNHPWHQEFEKGLTDKLKKANPNTVLYFEFLDAARFPNNKNRQSFFTFLDQKYRNLGIDYLVVESLPAVNAFNLNQNLLPEAERVLIAPGGSFSKTLESGNLHVPVQSDFKGSIEEMLRLTSPKQLFVIVDTLSAGGKKRLNTFNNALQKIPDKPQTRIWENLTIDDILTRASKLPKESAIYYLLIFQDGQKNRVKTFDVMQQISVAANAPLFTNWSTLLGYGTVGGYMISGELIGHSAAESIFNYAAGNKAYDAQQQSYGFFYDKRELDRWSIKASVLPANAQVQFDERSVLDVYRYEIILTLVTLLVLIAILVFLARINRQRKKLNDSLRKIANTDPLTGINNRRNFFTLVNSYLAMTERDKPKASVLLIDLDKFKNINDEYGHDIGDEALKATTRIISSFIRKGDVFARFGGEEFIVFLPDTDINQAKVVAEKIRCAVEKNEVTDKIFITISIGLSAVGSDINSAIKNADIALYQAKDQGRNCIRAYSEGLTSPQDLTRLNKENKQ